MATSVADRQVRISKIAGRYLVFDIDDVAYIRRHHGICAVFTGTMPQNPTQNVFLGLPIELYAEEARLLVDKKVGYIADDANDHLSRLKSLDEPSRKAYLQSLKTQRKNAQLVIDEARAQSQAKHKSKRKDKAPKLEPSESTSTKEDDTGLFDATPAKPAQVVVAKQALPAVTPTSTGQLISKGDGAAIQVPKSYPLYAYLNKRGYFITPGLRFGGDYSVYPGDPFRYHAHFMANSYGWDEQIPMLDIVTSGRLGTSVKKSFLMGAQQPVDDDNGDAAGDSRVRVFCIEWAGM
ncbi:tRNA-splicing endonuclease [Diplogelasinospora grovesii]|uniref:tRNA-splicing endonuclease subunit Sen34 n=1 Tax=Diplogelasinospora grovesii TaxID=303347 RepID=A0AAN6NIS6_9PEZI|nr:tRNA-splicing endonuclease [Diplogelasinospora grovesii]